MEHRLDSRSERTCCPFALLLMVTVPPLCTVVACFSVAVGHDSLFPLPLGERTLKAMNSSSVNLFSVLLLSSGLFSLFQRRARKEEEFA